MFCARCGGKNEEQSRHCVQCGRPLAPQAPKDLGEDPGMRMLLPVGRSSWAIAAGYLGLFSLLCAVLAPVSLVVSGLAIRDLRRNPEKHGMGRAVFGLVCGALITVVAVVLVVVAAVSKPA